MMSPATIKLAIYIIQYICGEKKIETSGTTYLTPLSEFYCLNFRQHKFYPLY